jgi:hypothetical protein
MDKILLTTAGVRLPGRMREPDIDHATMIYDHVMRGYHVTAKPKDNPLWQVSFNRFVDNAFINQPEGTTHVVRMYVTYWGENAALEDRVPPEWVNKLELMMDRARPSTTHLSKNITTTKSLTTTKETP